MTKQKKRLVGMGMKPRSTAVNTAVSTEQEAPVQEVEVSNNSGQPEVVSETVQVWSDDKPNGGSLDLKPVQNLESAEGVIAEVAGGDTVVAQNPISEDIPLVTKSVIDDLEKMMRESRKEAAQPEFELASGSPEIDRIVRPIFYPEKAEEMSEHHAAALNRALVEEEKNTYAIGTDVGFGEDRSTAAVIKCGEGELPDELVKTLDLKPLGELPNGEYRATVRLAEWCKEGCLQQAAADGLSLEDWLTGHLGSYLDAWWKSNGAK